MTSLEFAPVGHETQPRTLRVLLADGSAVLRSGLRTLLELEPGLHVVGTASTAAELLERVRDTPADVVVADLALPGGDGLDTLRRVVEMGTGARVLALVAHDRNDPLLPVLEAGGSGYVRKTSADQELAGAIRLAAHGGVFLYPGATRLLLHGFRTAEERGEAAPLRRLSPREREVLRLTAEGYRSAEVGRRLSISAKTVDTHRARLMRKLGLGHRSELVRFAVNTGVLDVAGRAVAEAV
jgi:two-component system response regulator NreC